jgi:hypothetical protein
MKRTIALFAVWFCVQTLTGFAASGLRPYPVELPMASPQEDAPRLANIAFGMGIGQLLAPVVLYGIGLGCFGGCAAIVIAAPAVAFVAFGVATFWVSLKALQRIRDGSYESGRGKAIFGLILGLAGAVFSGLILYSSLR